MSEAPASDQRAEQISRVVKAGRDGHMVRWTEVTTTRKPSTFSSQSRSEVEARRAQLLEAEGAASISLRIPQPNGTSGRWVKIFNAIGREAKKAAESGNLQLLKLIETVCDINAKASAACLPHAQIEELEDELERKNAYVDEMRRQGTEESAAQSHAGDSASQGVSIPDGSEDPLCRVGDQVSHS